MEEVYCIIRKQNSEKKAKKSQLSAFITEGSEVALLEGEKEILLGNVSHKFLLLVITELAKMKLQEVHLDGWKLDYFLNNIAIAEKWLNDSESVTKKELEEIIYKDFNYEEREEMEGLPEISKHILVGIKSGYAGYQTRAYEIARLSDKKDGDIISSNSIRSEGEKQSNLIIELMGKGKHLFC
jgi:hypothetical protein